MKDPYGEAGSFGNINNSSENLMNAVVTFETKGYNQAYNQQKKLTTEDNSIKNNDLQQSAKWIKVSEGYNQLGISQQAFQKHIQHGHFVTRRTKMNGGFGYEISVESIFNYYKSRDWEKCERILEWIRSSFDTSTSSVQAKTSSVQAQLGEMEESLTTRQKEIAMARDGFLRAYEKSWVGLAHGEVKEAKIKFIEAFNTGQLLQGIYAKIGNISLSSAERWLKIWNGANRDWVSLAPNYLYREIRGSILSEEERRVFLDLYLSPKKIKISKAYKLTKYLLEKRGIKVTASEATFRRFADEIVRKNKETVTLLCYGEKSLTDDILPYIERDLSQLQVGDVIIADGKTTTFDVKNPFTGRPSKATIIAYIDWASLDFVGYELMITENTQAVSSALRSSIIRLGKMPKIAYQDNGKAFRNKFFKGAPNFEELGFSGLFARLGITAVYSMPYNARAKAIEERWKQVVETFEKLLPSFTGTSPVDKPAYMMRNEKFHKIWKEKLTGNFIPTLMEAKEMIDAWLDFYRSQPHPRIKNKTIGEVFAEGRGEGVDINRLDDLMMVYGESPRKIYQNGVEVLEAHYYDEALTPWVGEYCRVKYSLSDLSEVVVEDLDGRKICRAKRISKVHPMAEYLGEPKDITELKEQLKRQKNMKREILNKAASIFEEREKRLLKSNLLLFAPQKTEEEKEPEEKLFRFLSDIEEDEEGFNKVETVG